ncbi:MAG: hypothetical protein LBN92_01090, partial [Treponema sp.]|nr:hypothetical protein [Treponema sp.]
MKKRFCLFLLGLAAAGGLGAQNVDRLELESNQAAINWINYEGPHSRIDTVEQIRAIGVELGRAIKNGARQAGANNRYFVIHCVSDPDGGKLDADVFGLGVDVGVDHIRNLRLIIQGYLQGAYDYSAADAAVLARFVTVYNAVFRGDWNFFSTRYKNPVVENLTAEKAGVSIRFDEWPGQTLMTIPLGTGGGLSALDTSDLTDPDVIDQMRSTDDRGIEDRQGMVDIKEREADEANQSATLQRGVIEEEEKNIQRDQEEVASTRRRVESQQREAERQRQEAEQQRQAAEARRQEAEQAAASGALSGEEAARQQREAEAQRQEAERQRQEADARAEEARRQAEEADQKQREIDERRQAQEERQREADAAQQKADQKTAEAQQERQQIARDQQDIIDNKPDVIASAAGQPAPSGVLAAVNLQSGSSLGRL